MAKGGKEKRGGKFVGFSGKTEHTGPAKRRDWSQCHKKSSWQVRQSRFCQKEKEKSRLSRPPDREVGESQGKQGGTQVLKHVQGAREEGAKEMSGVRRRAMEKSSVTNKEICLVRIVFIYVYGAVSFVHSATD